MHREGSDRPQGSEVSRRGFLEGSMVAGAVGVLAAVAKANDSLAPPGSPRKITAFALHEISIAQLQKLMMQGKLTSKTITQQYLDRIREIDDSGPSLNSVIEVNPDALEISESLDRERANKGMRGPLHGIPILIKDNIDTLDKMATTAGSLALIGAKPPCDAFLVQKLRQDGAVILGKTNLSEWANIRSAHSTSGWSARGGLTRNPYALDRNPSGSSSGSAVAVAASLCGGAVGTETDGSIISPSSLNGIVGIKPTLGLISRSGIVPISHSQDTAGPMCRSVEDAAILLTAMTGVDGADAVTAESKTKLSPDYTKFLNPNGLKGAKIGVVRKYFGFLPAVDVELEKAIKAMRNAGAIIIDPVQIPSFGKFDDTELTVLLYELKADLQAYFARLGRSTPLRTLKDVIDFNEKHRRKEMPYFGQDLFLKAQSYGPLTSREYLKALEHNRRMSREQGIDAVMNKHMLDALIAPSGGPAWMTDLIDGDHYTGGSSNMAAVAGYPSITVPAGYIYGMPIGLSFFGRAWSEPILIKLAYAFEQLTKARRPPQFLATADLKP